MARVFELEKQVAEVLAEALDWAVAALFGKATIVGKVFGLFFPPASFLEAVRLVYVLLDLVQLGVQAVWDFNARVELGMLHGPRTAMALPAVPAPSRGYT